MPSFDVVSEVDKHELQNAIDQAQREVTTRFDFKGVKVKIELKDNELLIAAPSEFQVQQLCEIVKGKLVKREIDPQVLDYQDADVNIQETRQKITIKQGIDKASAKEIVNALKENKPKLKAAIEGDKIRVTGKSRDDLQDAIAFLRQQKLKVALQFNNFRD